MDCYDILAIPNRTENWKTAKTFSSLITSNRQHKLASLIVENASRKHYEFQQSDVHIELFWKGFRDYCKSQKITSKSNDFIHKTAMRYERLFSQSRRRIEEYNSEAILKKHTLNLNGNSYVYDNRRFAENLYSNLLNTEIDVVLSAPGFLLIGEAKNEQTFGADTKHTLVHQLVRQYVMASILVELAEEKQPERGKITVIPFIIGDNVRESAQVRLLKYLNYLNNDNVFSWDKLKQLIGNYCDGI